MLAVEIKIGKKGRHINIRAMSAFVCRGAVIACLR